MQDPDDYNRRLIEEFRANGGRVGGQFEGAPLLLLTTTGARSGVRRTMPMTYMPDGDRLLVFASKMGAPTHPGWYHNLVANPEVTVEVGTETFEGTAIVTAGEERERLYAKAVERFPFLVDHQSRTSRQIPVIALERRAG